MSRFARCTPTGHATCSPCEGGQPHMLHCYMPASISSHASHRRACLAGSASLVQQPALRPGPTPQQSNNPLCTSPATRSSAVGAQRLAGMPPLLPAHKQQHTGTASSHLGAHGPAACSALSESAAQTGGVRSTSWGLHLGTQRHGCLQGACMAHNGQWHAWPTQPVSMLLTLQQQSIACRHA